MDKKRRYDVFLLVFGGSFAAGCAWVGFQVSEGMRRRVAELRELARGLALVERELELWAPPLPQLMERAAAALAGGGTAAAPGRRVSRVRAERAVRESAVPPGENSWEAIRKELD